MTSRISYFARIASHVPGRIRIKVGRGRHDPRDLGRIKQGLEIRDGVHNVSVNPATGSLTLNYDPKRHSAAGILGVLEDVDVIVESLTRAPALTEGGAAESLTVRDAVDDLNARVQRWTRLPVDLRTVLPLSFIGTGLWSLFRFGLGLERIPGWLLVWAGVDLFMRTRQRDVVSAADGQEKKDEPTG